MSKRPTKKDLEKSAKILDRLRVESKELDSLLKQRKENAEAKLKQIERLQKEREAKESTPPKGPNSK